MPHPTPSSQRKKQPPPNPFKFRFTEELQSYCSKIAKEYQLEGSQVIPWAIQQSLIKILKMEAERAAQKHQPTPPPPKEHSSVPT
jgi:hypothetical protein